MRDRLIELLMSKSCWTNECTDEADCAECDCIAVATGDADKIADYLLENGVIVPPCKVGDVIYDIRNGKVFGGKIIMTSYFGDSFTFVATGGYYIFTDIGKTVFLTKEEAEQKLRKDEGK